ncbi:MAG: hypothetical protein FWE80_08320 [Oscillospiraceae bacterium]|nr:hypothetical protein [Oscillospiraceae bacterium]
MYTPNKPPHTPLPETSGKTSLSGDQHRRFRITNPTREALNAAAGMTEREREDISSDMLGSYTGLAADGGRPEQDGDDI